ncbi:MAG: type II toxin-antitoxin system ParD family antitoxin [Deltaproteobacteria bacterium]|nr:type II toxin-antitoxin system ParD family antitoxin [Deltaproteobacteria bacterium]
MNVSLTPELEKFLNDKVQSGMYSSASEVIQEALRLMQERDQSDSQQLELIRAKIRRGIEQLDRGEGVPESIAVARLRAQRRRT